MKFAGNMVALVTPFRNGSLDLAALERLVEEQVQGGVSALVPCGTTGESPTLSHEEHDRVVAEVARMAAGRVPVVAGTGSNSTDEAVQMTRHAEKAGATASLQVAPYYNRPSQEGLYRHFMQIADSTGLPIVLYNIPGRCGVEISVETMARLAEHPRIVAVKEATGRVENTSNIRRRTDLDILAGDDALALPIIALGGRGVVSVLSNVLPARMTRLVASILAGDLRGSLREHDELFPLMRALFLETNPVPVKTALASMGRIQEEFRLPLAPMAAGPKAELLATLAGFL